MPVPSRVQDQALTAWAAAVRFAALVLLAASAAAGEDRRSGGSLHGATSRAQQPPPEETIRIGVTAADGSVRVTHFGLEDYVSRVLAGEGQPGAADAAQQALAITARTFALANRNRHRRENFDLCDTTHCQVFRPSTAMTRRVALATAGRVLMSQGQPASVFYSALCGGHSELASEVWPGAIDYDASSHADDACRDEPVWSSEMRAADIERALRAAGLSGDRLRDVRVLQRNASGRVSRMRVDGFTPNELTGHDFRVAVGRVAGWQRMKSTAFDVRRSGDGYRFTGRGFGHGVGLCVIGAGRRAAAGASMEAILRFYFPALPVQLYRAALATTATRARDPAPAASARTRDDVLIASPETGETDRTHVVELIRAARDEIAAKAGVTRPPAIRVTVHPTVESFGRSSGQPWWVSGATDGTAIELLPLTVLRQRGQLERTIRHEVAHVLLDQALSGRPLWVREGAAFYFGNPASASDAPGRVRCPADEEFLRPMSAGAHRNANARAEACFRRAIWDGKAWQDVK
jgi:SpoIID/LytB domain protein